MHKNGVVGWVHITLPIVRLRGHRWERGLNIMWADTLYHKEEEK